MGNVRHGRGQAIIAYGSWQERLFENRMSLYDYYRENNWEYRDPKRITKGSTSNWIVHRGTGYQAADTFAFIQLIEEKRLAQMAKQSEVELTTD